MECRDIEQTQQTMSEPVLVRSDRFGDQKWSGQTNLGRPNLVRPDQFLHPKLVWRDQFCPDQFFRDRPGSTKKSTLAHLQESFMATWSSINKPNVSSEQSKTLWTNFFLNISFKRIFYYLTRSLTHRPWYENWLQLWRKWLEFRGEKTFHNIKCLHVCTGFLQFWLWSFFMVAHNASQ